MDLISGNTRKVYFTLLLSALSSTILTTIYSTVDVICVGQYLGPTGSAAVACLNPFWTIFIAPGVLFGIGGAVMLNNRRGAGDEAAARRYFTISSIFTLLCAALVFLTVMFFTEELLILFGATEDTLEEAKKYMKPMLFAAPTFTVCCAAAVFIRNDGEAFLPTFATVIGGVINIIGDVFFVFDFGLGLGIYGAGLATATGQIVAFLIIMSYFFMRKCKLKFTKITRIGKELLKIITVGFSVFLAEVSIGFVAVFFNKLIVENLSTSHLGVFGAVSTATILLQSLYTTLGSALQPIASAGYGAGDYKRVRSVFKTAILCSIGLGVLFTAFSQALPLEILKAYMDVDATVSEIGPSILRKYTLAIGISGISIVISYYLQSILKRSVSVALSFARGLVFPCAFALLFSYALGFDFIWFAVPASELLTMILSSLTVKITSKSLR